MLSQYQQCDCDLSGWCGKLKCPEKNDCKHVRNRQICVDVTKRMCRDKGLPDWMGVPKTSCPKGVGQQGLRFGVLSRREVFFKLHALASVHCCLVVTCWPLGSCLWCLIVFLSLSYVVYPVSGVVFDCIDSWSLPPFLLVTWYKSSRQFCKLPCSVGLFTVGPHRLSFFKKKQEMKKKIR